MTIRTDIANLSPKVLIELYEWDATELGDTGVIRWHPGTTIDGQSVVWAGNTYQPMPVESEGWEITATGKLPRPILRASNISGSLGAYLRLFKDALGAKVTRRRTLKQYLDAANFPDGVNPTADPTAEFPPEIYYVARKVTENPIFVEMELATKPDVEGIMLPARQVIAGTCMWVYREPATCGYAGPPIYNDPVFPGIDKCGKTLTACKLRFGEFGSLPTSAFPASMLVAAG